MSDQDFSKKTCFIITPIGSPESTIRRKANGIIDSVILPVLTEELNFKEDNINIPHRTYSTGSITKQVIESILNDDLAIANLTGLNPNVMYELAVRHAARRPIVSIMESNTDLPFDISDERTIFYEDDIAEVTALKIKFKKMVLSAIDDDEPDNPIYRVLKEEVLERNIDPGSQEDYIISRLDKIDKKINNINRVDYDFNNYLTPRDIRRKIKIAFKGDYPDSKINSFIKDLSERIEISGYNIKEIINKKSEIQIYPDGNISSNLIDELIIPLIKEYDINMKHISYKT